MATQDIRIESILNGHSTLEFFGANGQFQDSMGIDPDMPATADPYRKAGGFITPTSMADFSGIDVNARPLWLETTPKNSNVYAYLENGKLISYDEALDNETTVSTLSTSSGNGMAYYDNYLYLATNTDIARYGPLNGTPAMTTDYWTSTLSKTALTNPTYPEFDNSKDKLPNHVMHYHRPSKKLYVADVVDNKGVLHFIQTDKSTVEGDTDDGSTHASDADPSGTLELEYGEYISDIESYGDDLVIASFNGTANFIKQSHAQLTFWDTASELPYKITSVEFPDQYITAVKNVNGILYVFSGSTSQYGGCRVSRFIGGYSMEELAFIPDAEPPYPGGVDHFLNRVVFGVAKRFPTVHGAVMAIGSKSKTQMGLHSILSLPDKEEGFITSVKYVNQWLGRAQPIVGYDGQGIGIASIVNPATSIANDQGNSYKYFKSESFRTGEGVLKEIILHLSQDMDEDFMPGREIKVYIYADGTPHLLATLDSNTKGRRVKLTPGIKVENEFYLALDFTGDTLVTVQLPIEMQFEKFTS